MLTAHEADTSLKARRFVELHVARQLEFVLRIGVVGEQAGKDIGLMVMRAAIAQTDFVPWRWQVPDARIDCPALIVAPLFRRRTVARTVGPPVCDALPVGPRRYGEIETR